VTASFDVLFAVASNKYESFCHGGAKMKHPWLVSANYITWRKFE